ncbi:MAG: addiction module protein [Phycisphaeraceae bacterium]
MADDDENFVDIAERIYAELKHLRPDVRADVVYDLLRRIEDEVDPEWEKAWLQEIRRRVRDVESGKADFIPGDVAMAMARERLNRLAHGDPENQADNGDQSE